MSEPEYPPLLSQARAALTESKKLRTAYWWLEVGAAVGGLTAAAVPLPIAAVLLALGAVAAKMAGRWVSSGSRSLFRQGERANRYHFEQVALGWEVPPRAIADLRLASSKEVDRAARARAARDASYYQASGPPGSRRFLHNLTESIFWTEKLLATMETRRWWQLAVATVLILLALVGAIVIGAAGAVSPSSLLAAPRIVGAVVSLLLALDLWGEVRAFRRGTMECRDLVAEVEAALRAESQEAGLRVFTEYSALKAELPLIPDEVYEAESPRLTLAWEELARHFPPPHGP